MANETCVYHSEATILSVFWYATFVAYNIATPIYFVLAVSGNGLLLFAFVKQLKSHKPYMYQVYVASLKMAEALFRTGYYVGTQAIFYTAPYLRFYAFQEALVRSYSFVWYANHVSTPLAVSVTTWSLLLSVAMAADRVYALLKPTAYKDMRHGRIQKAVLIVCGLVSFGASAYDCFRGHPVSDGDGRYLSPPNSEYINRPYVKVLAMLRVAIQMTALIALAALSVTLCYLYRTRFINVTVKMISNAEQKRKKEDERTLLLLTFIECSLTTVGMCGVMANGIFVYVFFDVFSCWYAILVPVYDMSRMLIDVSNFYVVMGMSKKIRAMIKTAIRSSLSKNTVSTVQVISPTISGVRH